MNDFSLVAMVWGNSPSAQELVAISRRAEKLRLLLGGSHVDRDSP